MCGARRQKQDGRSDMVSNTSEIHVRRAACPRGCSTEPDVRANHCHGARPAAAGVVVRASLIAHLAAAGPAAELSARNEARVHFAADDSVVELRPADEL